MIAYGLFNMRSGELHSLYVETNRPIPVGSWIDANEDAAYIEVNGVKRVKSKLGQLAWRPGKHLAMAPLFDHIGKRQPDGTLAMRSDSVICECEFASEVDWTPVAERLPGRCLKHLPYGGFYYFKTNPNAAVPWVITSRFKVNRVLTDDEIKTICKASGLSAQKKEVA